MEKIALPCYNPEVKHRRNEEKKHSLAVMEKSNLDEKKVLESNAIHDVQLGFEDLLYLTKGYLWLCD